MKKTQIPVIVIGPLAVLGSIALAAQDRYTLRIPDGLAFFEFSGYEMLR